MRAPRRVVPDPVSQARIAAVKQALKDEMDAQGITDPETRAGIAALAAGETGFRLRSEDTYANTPNEKIRSKFGARVNNLTDDQLNVLKHDDRIFFNVVYAGRLGNTHPDDGYTYRGRGPIQLTGRDNYNRFGRQLGIDLINKPDLVNDPVIGARTAVRYIRDRYRGNGFEAMKRAVGNAVAGTEEVKDARFAEYLRSGEFAARRYPLPPTNLHRHLEWLDFPDRGAPTDPDGGTPIDLDGGTPIDLDGGAPPGGASAQRPYPMPPSPGAGNQHAQRMAALAVQQAYQSTLQQLQVFQAQQEVQQHQHAAYQHAAHHVAHQHAAHHAAHQHAAHQHAAHDANQAVQQMVQQGIQAQQVQQANAAAQQPTIPSSGLGNVPQGPINIPNTCTQAYFPSAQSTTGVGVTFNCPSPPFR
jgi:predicted chitinase